MKYDFDAVIERRGMGSAKWDFVDRLCPHKDVLPMWVADMDFRSPQPVIEELKRKADHGFFGYAGITVSYYEAVIRWMKRRHNWDIQQEWLVHTPGVVPALHIAVSAFSQPGDQVIVQPPVYYPFFNAIKSSNREILENPLIYDGGRYFMNFEDLKRKITSRTKIIILCNPHNPISRVWEKNILEQLGQICLDHDILVVSDEIHCDLVYSGFRHIPFATISDKFASNSIICTAASKTFNLPGLHTSNIIIANPDLRKIFKETVRSYASGSTNVLGIAATEAAYRYGDDWLDQLLPYLESNIAFLNGFAASHIPGLRVTPMQGTYLAWLDFRDCRIPPAKLGNFVRDEAKVALEPGIMFGCKETGFERMNIACPRALLQEGLSRIEQAINTFS